MAVELESSSEAVTEAELVGTDKIAVVESMNELGEDGRLPEESIARTVIPYNRDDDRARWLGFRASGFTSREATQLIERTASCISNWRTDPEFVELEKRIPEFRKQLAEEYCEIEFVRNFRLVLEKDYQIIKKSLEPAIKVENGDGGVIEMPVLSKQENDYLLKSRAYYTPQQFAIMTSISKNGQGSSDDAFDFTKAVLTIARSSERMELSVGK